MTNQFMPNLSGTNGFDFMKQMWSGLPLSNMLASSTDLHELDKRIKDLKAVEQWLNMNLGLLRATIQGLEVQRGTLAALQSFGASLGAETQPDASSPSLSPFAGFFSQHASAASHADEPSQDAPEHANPAPRNEAARHAQSAQEAGKEATEALFSNATVWWDLMQEQMNKMTAAASASKTASPDTAKDTATSGATSTAAKQSAAERVGKAAAKSAKTTAKATKPAKAGNVARARKVSPPAKTVPAAKTTATATSKADLAGSAGKSRTGKA
ncbi:MAG: hypothetical protein HC848_07885 [Limnobacter sp.]|nr:hypothetical protein [Limnobacter sp.]